MAEDAITILQDWLDRLSDAILAGDRAAWRRYISLPYLHSSNDTRLVIETVEDMERGLRTFGDSLRAQGVNQFVRLAVSAEFLSDDYISGTCVNHILRNAVPMVPSFSGCFVLRRSSSGWKLVEVHHDISHGSWPITLMKVPQHGQDRQLSPAEDARRQAAQPLALYQSFLNRLTAANVSGDFEGYLANVHLPYTNHSESNDEVMDTPDAVRKFFDMLTGMLTNNRIEEFLRIAQQAEFISNDTICGYHVARFIRDGRDALPSVRSRMILRREGVRWKLASVTNAVTRMEYPYSEPVASDTLVTQIEIQERTRQ